MNFTVPVVKRADMSFKTCGDIGAFD